MADEITPHEKLLAECKKGMGLQGADDNVTAMLDLVLQAAEGLILGGGVSESVMYHPMRAGAVALIVNDLWNNAPGETKLSPMSLMFITQMALQSQAEEANSG